MYKTVWKSAQHFGTTTASWLFSGMRNKPQTQNVWHPVKHRNTGEVFDVLLNLESWFFDLSRVLIRVKLSLNFILR